MHFAHGLYVTLRPTRDLDEGDTRQLAEWARDAMRDQYVVRIAFSDLPTAVSDEICYAIASWWQERR